VNPGQTKDGRLARFASAARVGLIAVFVAGVLSGCSGWWPGRSDGPIPERLPAGVVDHTCAGNKRLLVRFEPDGKAAWVYFPDRQFRLDRVGSADRYSNGGTSLTVSGESLSLDEDSRRTFDDCKRKQAN
jgi:hypothetical protein